MIAFVLSLFSDEKFYCGIAVGCCPQFLNHWLTIRREKAKEAREEAKKEEKKRNRKLSF